MTDRIQNRRGTATQWTSVNPTLLSGELGVETDTGKLKVGDGSTAWASRNYAGGSTNASDLVSGTVNDARLSANVPLKNAANTFTLKQTMTDRRDVISSTAGVKFPYVEEYEYATFGGTCEDHVFSQTFNKSGTVATHPVFNIGVENFFITNANQKLLEVNWDYISIDRNVQYRPMAFSIDCDTHLANWLYTGSRTVNTRTNVSGNYLVDNIACGATGVLQRQLQNTVSTGKVADIIQGTQGDVYSVWSTNGVPGYVGIDASSGDFMIGIGNAVNDSDVIKINANSRQVDIHGFRVTTTTLNLPHDAWISAGATTQNRFFFLNTGTTYLRGHGSVPIEFRNAADTTLAWINSGGGAVFTGQLQNRDGLAWNDSGTQNNHWVMYKNTGDTILYLRDVNTSPNRMHAAFQPGASSSAANTYIYSNILCEGALSIRPAASANPAENGDLVFERTSNTSLTIKLKGSDGTVRSTSLTLS